MLAKIHFPFAHVPLKCSYGNTAILPAGTLINPMMEGKYFG